MSENVQTTVLEMGFKVLEMGFNPFNLKIQDLYLETWSTVICVEKALHAGVDIWDYLKTDTFNNFVYFKYFRIFTIIITGLFLFFYISLLALLSIPKLILSSFLSLLFIITIY